MFQSVFNSIRRSLKTISNVGVIVVRKESTNIKSNGSNGNATKASAIAAQNKAINDAIDKCFLEKSGHTTPPCTRRSIETNPCNAPLPKEPMKKKIEIRASMWENPPCCNEVSKDCEFLRHDILYLKPKEKSFKRTWCEYPTRCKVQMPICKQQRIIVSEMEVRPRGEENKAATKSQPPISLDPKCPKVPSPGCKLARKTTKCSAAAKPKCCRKRCTLYPSFSECCRRRPKKLPYKECGCLDPVGLCAAYHPTLLKALNDD